MILDLIILFISLTLISLLSALLVCLILVRKLKEQAERMIAGNLESLTEKELRFRRTFPHATEAEILEHIIRSECRIAGCIGFLTGLGGLVTLPLTLPIDILTSVKSQRNLVEYIIVNSHGSTGKIDRAKTFAIILGTRQASQMGIKFTVSLAIKYAPQIFLKAIPLVGGLTGFITSYYSTRSVARYAKRSVKAMV